MLFKNIFSSRSTFFFCIVVFVAYLFYRVILIFYPTPDIGGVENNVIWFIQRILDGGHLYTDPNVAPYSIAQYFPLYYYINAGIARLLGINADDVLSLFVLSRTVSLFFNLTYVALIIVTAKNIFNCRTHYAYVAGIFTFIFLEITSFSRPDSLNHALFLLSFYCFATRLKKNEAGIKGTNYLLLSAFFAACALFSKQSSLVLAIIMLVWFLKRKEIRLIFIWLLVYATTISVVLFIVNFESGLTPFLQNTIGGINNGISTYWFFHNIINDFYRQFGLLWIPALVLVIGLLKKETETHYQFTVISIIIVFIFSNLIALKWGSSPGYFTEWVTFIFVCIAAYWDIITVSLKELYSRIGAAILVVILLVKLLLIFYPTWNMIRPGAKQIAWEKYYQQANLARDIKSKLHHTTGSTVFNNVYSPEFYLNNLLFRECVMPQFEVVIFGTWKNKVFDYTGFRKALNSGEIKYVVEKSGSPHQFMDITLSKFQIIDTISRQYHIYKFIR